MNKIQKSIYNGRINTTQQRLKFKKRLMKKFKLKHKIPQIHEKN